MATPIVAQAQYLFADSNGDGLYTSADRLNAAGPTTITIWLRTDQNKDGSVAACGVNAAQPLSLFSYEFILRATGGNVKWGKYTNLLPGMEYPFGTFTSSTDCYSGYGGITPLPPGKHKLGTLVVTVTSGDPTLTFASTTPIWAGLHTSLGSMCGGKGGRNTLYFTESQPQGAVTAQASAADWSDADGVGAPSGAALASAMKPNSQEQSPRPDGVSPNPLNPQGWITFSMKLAGSARVTLYDTQGRLVRVLLPRQDLPAGSRSVRIDGLDDRGKKLGSGVYFGVVPVSLLT
jgi:hypothetical protein